MPLHRAVSCDADGCLALYLAAPPLGPDAAVFAARRAGWNISAHGLTTRCPACSTGRTPVLERGDCPTCTGRTHHNRRGEVCQYCGHLVPDQDTDDGDQEQHDHGQDDAELLAVVHPEKSSRP